MKRTAVIIDDERLARLSLSKELDKFPEIQIVGEASGFDDGRSLVQKTKPDIIFLDIQLNDKEGNGFDLLNKMEYTGEVIFVTAFDEYAIRAFEVNAVDYLLKPVSHKRLKKSINRLFEGDKKNDDSKIVKLRYEDRLMLTRKNNVNFISLKSISVIRAAREYSYIITEEGKEFFTSKTITDWERRLPEQNFCRIHRSTIINFDHILNIQHSITGTGEVLLKGQPVAFQISRNYYKYLKDRYSL